MTQSIVLRERLFGGGYVGQITAPPSLSWRERQAISATATSSAAAANAASRSADTLGQLVDSVSHLESTLGYELGAQTEILRAQLDTLADIAQSLRSPAKVRAAERIATAGQLLQNNRFDRALETANAAIADDPTDPAGFQAAGWAHMGLGQASEARASFREEALASSNPEGASAARRRAARLTFALEGASRAISELAGTSDHVSDIERAAVSYDRSVYLAVDDRLDDAKNEVDVLAELDARLCSMIETDPLVTDVRLRDHVRARVDDATARVLTACETQAAELGSAIDELDTLVNHAEVAGLPGEGSGVRQWLRDGMGITVTRDQLEADIATQKVRIQPRLSTQLAIDSLSIRGQASTFVRETVEPMIVRRVLTQHLSLVAAAEELWHNHGVEISIGADGMWSILQSGRAGRVIEMSAWVSADGRPFTGLSVEANPRPLEALHPQARAAVEQHVALVLKGLEIVRGERLNHFRMLDDGAFACVKTRQFGPPKNWVVRATQNGEFSVGHT